MNRLEILIPAYEFSDGVTRILDSIYSSSTTSVTCIIRDDSLSNDVEIATKNHVLYATGFITYIRNTAQLGAVNNWNELVKLTDADYAILMHHDECPSSNVFYDKIIEEINRKNCPDIIILDYFLAINNSHLMRRYFPLFIKQILLHLCPKYLLFRNFIGAPSAIVFNLDKFIIFNQDLQWLVDVEWYVRLLTQENITFVVASEVGVVSLAQSGQSITDKIKDKIPEIKTKELSCITNDHQIRTSTKLNNKIILLLEALLWVIIKLVSFLPSIFSIIRLPSYLKK